MPDRPENPPAFAHGDPTHGGDPGMSLRDWFAGQALPAIFAETNSMSAELIALAAYEIADAMLLARGEQ